MLAEVGSNQSVTYSNLKQKLDQITYSNLKQKLDQITYSNSKSVHESLIEWTRKVYGLSLCHVVNITQKQESSIIE